MNNKQINNEKSSMTYEELMNSHFLKYPTHSKIVHAIFNPFVVASIILVATTAYVKIVDGDWVFALMVGGICSMFLSMIKKGRLSVLGLPTPAVVMFAIIFGLLLTITIIGYTAPNGGFERVQMLGTSMLFGFIMSVLSWRFHSYYTMWYGSKYDAMMEFKNKGYDEETIKLKVEKLKKMGIILD